MTVFVKTDDAIYPCDGYFFIRMTNVAPNKWGVFATQLGLAQPTLLTESFRMTRYSAAMTRR